MIRPQPLEEDTKSPLKQQHLRVHTKCIHVNDVSSVRVNLIFTSVVFFLATGPDVWPGLVVVGAKTKQPTAYIYNKILL